MSVPPIEVVDVVKDYPVADGLVRVLRSINMVVYEGEMVAIMGASGSGKTTLLNILGCLDTPTSGAYNLDGVDVSRLNRNELAKVRNEKIGFIFQSFNLIHRATALRNVEIPLVYGRYTKWRRSIAKGWLRTMGLGHRLDHRPSQLSGGEQQRVAITRALVTGPRIILADEPTGNVDSLTGEKILSLLKDVHNEGNTLLVVTHSSELARKCERTLVLRDGQFVDVAQSAV
ncbi:MAG: ABC transporter ATP-binding protein [Planctomycetota bacterium]|nr:ABC transporter ATP-binding protein [Planctomycetota bacterium]